MTRTLYLLYDDDSYEIEADGLRIVAIWRYRNNRNSRPEFCQYSKLTDELKNEIDHKLLKGHGEPTNTDLNF